MTHAVPAARPEKRPVRRRLPAWWWLLPILLLVFWLSAHNLDTNPVWGDERFSIRDAGGLFYGPLDLFGVWERVATGNPWHVPGYFMLLHYWGKLVGWELPALRTLALLFGLLTLAWTYRLGRDVLSARAGLYATLILGTSMLYVHYLIKVRMYTQITVLTVFTLWVYLRLVDARRQPRGWEWLALGVGAVGLLYTHYFAAIPLIGIGLYHLLFARKDRRWWGVVGVLALAGSLFLPWVSVLYDGLLHARDYEDLHEIAVSSGEALYRIAFLFGNTHLWLMLAALALAAVFTVRERRRGGRGILQLWFFAAVIMAVILVINEALRVMHEGRLRYLIGLWPLLALIIGYGIAALERWRRGVALLVAGLFAITGVVSIGSRAASADLDGFAYLFPFHRIGAALEDAARPGDAVINFLPDGDEPRRDFHYAGITPFYFGSHLSQTWLRSEDAAKQTQTLASLNGALSVWLAYRPQPSALESFTDSLAAEYAFCRTFHRETDFTIDWYVREPLCCPDESAAARIVYPDGIGLIAAQSLPITDEGLLPVLTTWAIAPDSPYYGYSMALHVLDSAGTLVAQADMGLELPARICRPAQIPVGDLAAGEYSLQLIVYNWETGTRLIGQDVESAVEGDRLPLLTFEVE